jgi:hypothetical protein
MKSFEPGDIDKLSRTKMFAASCKYAAAHAICRNVLQMRSPSPPAASWSLMSAHRIRPIIVSGKPRPSARYIGELTRELARLARTDGCETLSYLLELATIEAELMGGLPEGQSLS